MKQSTQERDREDGVREVVKMMHRKRVQTGEVKGEKKKEGWREM